MLPGSFLREKEPGYEARAGRGRNTEGMHGHSLKHIPRVERLQDTVQLQSA